MGKEFKSPRHWRATVGVGVALSLILMLVLVAVGCGDSETTTTASKTTAAKSAGKIYVAVTGTGELAGGTGNMGMAIVDLETKKVEMVNLAEAKAPHGIIFSADTNTAANTDGRVTSDAPKTMLIGNAEDGAILTVDMATKKVTKTAAAPASAKLAICGMYKGPDGKIYLTSMGDGKVYPYDPATSSIGAAMPNEAGTTSICGISWSKDGKNAYLVNMFNPTNPLEPGYVAKIEWPSGKMISKIDNVTKPSPEGKPMSHQSVVSPDHKFMYVADGIDGAIVKIDLDTDKIVKSIALGTGEPHAMVISSDGKTGYIGVRHAPDANQSSIFVMDMEKETVTGTIPGITAPLICGVVLLES
ncbi:MAG: YncE family protein [Thermoleophilia bacterium]